MIIFVYFSYLLLLLLLNLCVCVLCTKYVPCRKRNPHHTNAYADAHNPIQTGTIRARLTPFMFRKSRDYRIMRSGSCTQVYGIVSRILLVCYSKCQCHATNLFWSAMIESNGAGVAWFNRPKQVRERGRENERAEMCFCMWVKWKRGGIMHISTI